MLNASGQAVGLSTRFENELEAGQTIWFFDPEDNITVPVLAEIDGVSVGAYPIQLTDQGVLFGAYWIDNFPLLFWWSADAGFHDLGQLVTNDDSRYEWQSLSTSGPGLLLAGLEEDASPSFILGAAPLGDTYYNAYLLAASVPSGDADLDGDVDLSDLGVLATNYGAAHGRLWTQGDFDGDGDVDLSDLGTLATNYGAGQAQALIDFAQITSVPEPAGLLFAIALSMAPRRPRDRRTASAAR